MALLDQLLEFDADEVERVAAGTQRIHRIFPFERFVDLLRTGELTFAKPNSWQDPFENPFNQEITDLSTGKPIRIIFDNTLYAQCWSSNDESDAMWRIYSPDKRSVLVTANAGVMLRTAKFEFDQGYPFERLYLGKVRYLSEDKFREHCESLETLRAVLADGMYSTILARTLLIKRDPFAHESEVRLIHYQHIGRSSTEFAKVKIDPFQCIERVVLDPRLSVEEAERQRFLLTRVGYAKPIEQSKLYATPKLKLSIPKLYWWH